MFCNCNKVFQILILGFLITFGINQGADLRAGF